MDIQELLDLLFAQGKGAVGSNPALKGLTPQMIAKGQNTKGLFSSPSLASKATLPLLIGGSLSSMRDTPGMRGISQGLNALALLSMLGQQ